MDTFVVAMHTQITFFFVVYLFSYSVMIVCHSQTLSEFDGVGCVYFQPFQTNSSEKIGGKISLRWMFCLKS